MKTHSPVDRSLSRVRQFEKLMEHPEDFGVPQAVYNLQRSAVFAKMCKQAGLKFSKKITKGDHDAVLLFAARLYCAGCDSARQGNG